MGIIKGYTPTDILSVKRAVVSVILVATMLLDIMEPFSVKAQDDILDENIIEFVEDCADGEIEIELESEGSEDYGEIPVEEIEKNLEVTIEMQEEELPEPTVIYPVAAPKYYTENDVIMVAILITGEAGSVPSDTEKSGVAWTVANRVDSPKYPGSISAVVTQRSQFAGYRAANGHYNEDSYRIARDVLERWNREKNGETNVGRTLPKEYLYFNGDGVHNYFTKTVDSSNYYVWSETPYQN